MSVALVVLPLVGTAVGGGLVLFGEWLRDKRALVREREARVAAAVDVRRERLRLAYAAAIPLAQAIESAARQANYLLEGDTVEDRDRRIFASLVDAEKPWKKVEIDLLLDNDGVEVQRQMTELISTHREIDLARLYGSHDAALLRQREKSLFDGVESLVADCRDRLARMDPSTAATPRPAGR